MPITNVHLSDSQKRKITDAFRLGHGVSLKLPTNCLHGNDKISLTQTELDKLKTARKQRKEVNISISASALKAQGGIFPFLAPLLAALPAIVAGASKAIPAIAAAATVGKNVYDVAKGKGMRVPGSGMRVPGTGMRRAVRVR